LTVLFFSDVLNPPKSKAISKLLKHSEDVSFWVATTIVREALLPDRVLCVRKFISVAQQCLKKGNFGTPKVLLLP
jgi:hypothetical protein